MTIKSNKILGSALIKLEMIFLKLLLKTGYPFAQIAATIIRKTNNDTRKITKLRINGYKMPPLRIIINMLLRNNQTHSS